MCLLTRLSQRIMCIFPKARRGLRPTYHFRFRNIGVSCLQVKLDPTIFYSLFAYLVKLCPRDLFNHDSNKNTTKKILLLLPCFPLTIILVLIRISGYFLSGPAVITKLKRQSKWCHASQTTKTPEITLLLFWTHKILHVCESTQLIQNNNISDIQKLYLPHYNLIAHLLQ